MGAIEDWKRREELRSKVRALEETYQRVYQLVANGQYAEASERVVASYGVVEELGEGFTLTQWPACLGCFPHPGTGEAGPTAVKATPTLCVDAPHLCYGNRYGKMHPTQLADFIEGLQRQRAVAGEQREAERVESQRVPDPPPLAEMQPTPPAIPPTLPPLPGERED